MKAGIFSLLFLTLFISCSKDDKPFYVPPDRLLLVYMGTDNDLHAEASAKLEALKSALPRGIEAYVYIDSREGAQLRHLSFTDDRIIKNYGTQDHASAETLTRVIGEVLSISPSYSEIGMLVFSHASGWLPQGMLETPAETRSMFRDDGEGTANRSEMELADFARAIPDGLFDYIMFEMCHMSGVEVAYELKEKTKYIVASCAEIISPGFLNVYEKMLVNLARPGTLSERLSGLAQAYYEYAASSTAYLHSATVTVSDTNKLDAVTKAVRQEMEGFEPDTTFGIETLQYFDRPRIYSNPPRFFDLLDFLTSISPAGAEEFARLIADVVVYQAATDSFMPDHFGFDINKHCGLTCYVPQDGLAGLNQAYTETAWYRATR